MSKKVAVIGAGSAYTPVVIESFAARASEWPGAELVLMDPATERMDVVWRLGSLMVQAAGADIRVRKTTDLRDALDGADFVLTTFRVGGLEGLDVDERLPMSYGMVGDETQGPGGIFMALRTLPAIKALVAKMEELCPSAWLVNYTNPTHYVADFIRQVSPIKTLSLCDGFQEAIMFCSELLGVPADSVEALTAGINHCTWVLRLTADGRDAYPNLRTRAGELRGTEQNWGRQVAFDLLDIVGYLPCPVTHMLPYYCRDEYLERTRDGRFKSLGQRLASASDQAWRYFKSLADSGDPAVDWSLPYVRIYGSRYHGDLAVNVIDAIANDRNRVFIVNIPNDNLIDNLEAGAIVEVPAVVGKHGYRGLRMGELPRPVVGLVQHLIAAEGLTVEAFIAGDKKKLLQAFIANPLTTSYEKSRQLLLDMANAHRAFLSPWLWMP